MPTSRFEAFSDGVLAILLGSYGNNHHHMLQVTTRVNGRIL